MRYLVVGGHARGVGKTALVVDVIRAFPEAAWTAVKISSHGHGAWPEQTVDRDTAANGAVAELGAILEEETDRAGGTDSSRFLAAGARRAFWLRARPGSLAEGMNLLRRALDGADNVIVESNAVLEFIRPELFLMVVDHVRPELKDSARQALDRVDAFVLRHGVSGAVWEGTFGGLLRAKPRFEQQVGEPLPEALVALIRERLFAPMHPGTPREHLPG